MAFLVKNVNRVPLSQNGPAIQASPIGVFGTAPFGVASLLQLVKVSRPTLLVPQTTTEILFRVYGGRILVHFLFGTVTTVMPATDAQLSVLSCALTVANPPVAIGTATTIASSVTSANREVGGTFNVEGDGTALVAANAGCTLVGTNTGRWVAPAGEIYLNAAANSVTGKIQWDMWYQPLDEGAYSSPSTQPPWPSNNNRPVV